MQTEKHIVVIKKIHPLFIAALLISLIALIYVSLTSNWKKVFSFGNNSTKTELLNIIKHHYVSEVNTTNLNSLSIPDILAQLDPYCKYIEHDKVAILNNEISGNYTGIGIQYNVIHDSLTITYVSQNSAAKQAGLQVGDVILLINKSIVTCGKQANYASIPSIVKGLENTSIHFKIKRGNEIFEKEIVRKKLDWPSVDVCLMLTNNIGLIHINKFTEHTHKDFMYKLDSLQKKGLKKLIVDVRYNGGGLVNSAVQIADEFLTNEKIVGYTIGQHEAKENLTCKKEGMFEEGELIILTNDQTASSAEILCAAIADNKRGIVIGSPTLGKALIQQTFTLSNGDVVQLSTKKALTPNSHWTQKPFKGFGFAYSANNADKSISNLGIIPNVQVKNNILEENLNDSICNVWHQYITAIAVDFIKHNIAQQDDVQPNNVKTVIAKHRNSLTAAFKQVVTTNKLSIDTEKQESIEAFINLITKEMIGLLFNAQVQYEQCFKEDACINQALATFSK